MIGPKLSERQMLPRWRQSIHTVQSGETDPVGERTARPWSEDKSELALRINSWRRRRSSSSAVELITSALLFDKATVGEKAAQFILNNFPSDSLPYRLANRLLTSVDSDKQMTAVAQDDMQSSPVDERETIRSLRATLKSSPRNPLGWVDLAYAYASVGLGEKADRCMFIALASSSPSRILLRSASRLYVHQGERDKAHALLFHSDRVRHDPWLLAAELATAALAGTTSKLIRYARQWIREQSVHPFHLTELAGALATMELEAGKDRRARQLFRLSLEHPTDNSVAQAEWASRLSLRLNVSSKHISIARGYEARVRRAFSSENWEEALTEARFWLKDEMFSSTPAIFGSYAASVGSRDFEKAAEIARQGLRANPTDHMLRNNLVFSLANLGEIEEAEDEFQRIGRAPTPQSRIELRSPQTQMALKATAGLLEYRRGNIDHGKLLYSKAIEIARDLGNHRALCLATTFFAHEELLSVSSTAGDSLREALRVAKRGQPVPELAKWYELLQELNEQPPADGCFQR